MKPHLFLLEKLIVFQIALLFGLAETNPALAKHWVRASPHHAAHSDRVGGQTGKNVDAAGSPTGPNQLPRRMSEGPDGDLDHHSAAKQQGKTAEATGSAGESPVADHRAESWRDKGTKDATVEHQIDERHPPGTEPIDVSITTTRSSFWFRHTAKAQNGTQRHEWSKTRTLTGWMETRGHHHGTATSEKKLAPKRNDPLTINAIGLPVHRARLDRYATHVDGALQSAAPKVPGSADNVNVAAIGTTPPRDGFVPATPNGHLPHSLSLNTTMNPAIINGHDMIHAGMGAGAIGGTPRKLAAGIISGSDFHPRHP